MCVCLYPFIKEVTKIIFDSFGFFIFSKKTKILRAIVLIKKWQSDVPGLFSSEGKNLCLLSEEQYF